MGMVSKTNLKKSIIMKIFITGSSGFIGSYLVPALSTKHHVLSMRSDLLDFNSVKQEVQEFNPDIIVHLAARTEVEKSFYEQQSFSQVNYVGSVNLIEAAKTVKNLKNFVFASTMEVYGWQPISDCVINGTNFYPIAFDEHTKPNPNAPYAVAKYAVEKYLEYMHRSQQFPFTAIRQTNTYGRRDNNFFVTEQIITQMLSDKREINLGCGESYRNFIFITDLIDVWTSVIENYSQCNQGLIFTIGPDDPVQIKDYVKFIAKKIGWDGTVNWNTKPERPGEIYWLNSNHQLITSVLGWKPKVNLSNGIDYTIQLWKDTYRDSV
jgi:nucleoside-diphosphate-sugar epimerase